MNMNLLNDSFDIQKALRDNFGITTDRIEQLKSYDDLNYKIESGDQKYIVKITMNDSIPFVKTQNKYLRFLADRGFVVPVTILTKSKEEFLVINKRNHLLRLLTYIEGEFYSSNDADPLEKAFQIGYFLGQFDAACLEFDHIGFANDSSIWNLENFSLCRDHLQFITEDEVHRLVHHFIIQFEQRVQPSLRTFRKALIHNDPNFENILSIEGKGIGLIDFGDMVYAPVICHTAIGLCYQLLDNEDQLLQLSKIFIQQYSESIEFTKEELSVLYYLVAARISTSICASSQKLHDEPENTYAQLDRNRMVSLLIRIHQINPLCFYKEINNNIEPISNEINVTDFRKRMFSSSMSLSYNQAIHMEQSSMQYMYAKNGITYLDGVNNIMHVGHNHPTVVEAAIKQMTKLNTNTRYHYDQLYTYSEKLLSKFPSKLSKLFLVNSGSAATDLATRIAKSYTRSNHMIVMDHGYHGNTKSAIDISPYKFNGKGGSGKNNSVFIATVPDLYRNDLPVDKQIEASIAPIKEVLESGEKYNFISESILGCGGQVVLPKDYLQQVYKLVRANGGICIADEVQVGFGRVGSHFWGYELYNVIPDIVILGKPIGNGYPMGAVVCTEEVCQKFESGMEFFSSFGGNPISCAIGSAVLDVLDQAHLQQHALELGNYIKEQWTQLVSDFESIGDVRGEGLFLGLECVTNKKTMIPDSLFADKVVNHLKTDFHILLSIDGPNHNVIKFKPPLVFSYNNADYLYDALRTVFQRSDKNI